jgi:hypothetical protein
LKTKKQVLSEYPKYKTLINAVISRIGMDSVNDVIRHGVDGGFHGFIYYSDTHAFAIRHRKSIIRLLEEEAEMLGEETVEMVSHFGVFRNNKMENADRKELYRYLGGSKCEPGTITNVMAWFAAEEVCRFFEE